MRMLVAGRWAGPVGGVETYLDALLPALVARGHEVGFLHEERRSDGRTIVPETIRTWQAGPESAGVLAELREWAPDVLYTHGLKSHVLEGRLLDLAPAVAYVHGYYGTCVSGTKTLTRPQVEPCTRRFGSACLWHYFPRGCGGWSPLTMWRQYRLQGSRLALLQRYRAVLVASAHMAEEYRRHGFGRRVTTVRLPVIPVAHGSRDRAPAEDGRWRLLYLGRMEVLKGVLTLIDAAVATASELDRPVVLTLAGRGSAVEAVRSRAAAAGGGRVEIRLKPWLGEAEKAAELCRTDLIVVPSLWPEPFGLSGIEAGCLGIPAVGTAVGGIPEWLEEGINGALATERPLTAAAFAGAIVRCLGSVERYARLSAGARERAARYTLDGHVERIEHILAAASRRSAAVS